jgi:mRNA-degrading endonuclease toxin of MazEF toxin-antitoxin module
VVGRRGAYRRRTLAADELVPRRSYLFFATVPVRDGEVRKRVLVVSRDPINEAGMDVLAARVTSQDRFRGIPSVVEVEPSEDNGLPETNFVLCHSIVELAQDKLDARPLASYPSATCSK